MAKLLKFVPSTAVWKPDTAAERVYRIRTIHTGTANISSEVQAS